MRQELRELLELFIAKADEMMSEEFRSYLRNNRKVSFRFDSQEGVVERNAPSRTLINSFATSYRIFTSAEDISIRGLAKLTNEPDISDGWKREYGLVRDKVNGYLDHETNLHIGDGGAPLTPRYIADIFINGWIFHVKDAEKREVYSNWRSDDLTFHAVEQEFILAMHQISRAIEYLADLCRRELAIDAP